MGALLVAYGAASLVHFIHNAEFLGDYPGLPATWTRAGSLGHYVVAPMSSHSTAMNATILLEVAAAGLLLAEVFLLVARRLRPARSR